MTSTTVETELKLSWLEALTINRALIHCAKEVRWPEMLLRLAQRFAVELAGQDPYATRLPSLTATGNEWVRARGCVCTLKHQGHIDAGFADALLATLDATARIAKLRHSEAIGEESAARLLRGAGQRPERLGITA